MSINDRYNRSTFESVEFLIESTESPKIKAGGSSSSNILNRYFNSLCQDVALLATRSNILASRSNRIEAGCSAQSGALSASFSSLSARVDAASAYNQVLADMHSEFYLDTTNLNWNCDLDQNFGQATLPVLSTSDLLVQLDVYGNKYISPDTTFSFSSNNASGISYMSVTDFVQDPEGIFMIREDQTWIQDVLSGQVRGFIRIAAPLQFLGLTPNVLEIWPLPAFEMALRKVSYRLSGDPENIWTDLDLTYLPGYNSTTLVVDKFGPVRLHLDNEAIVEIAIEVDTSMSTVWGFKRIKLYNRQYASNGVVIGMDPYSRTVGNAILRGKDPDVLSTFSISTTNNKVSVAISAPDSTSTCVLTGILFSVT